MQPGPRGPYNNGFQTETLTGAAASTARLWHAHLMHGYMHTIPHFETITGFEPYPWQVRTYQKLLRGDVPFELTLPTGTGKTSAVLLYLLALAQGADLPRRLAYIVDRRAIVDQTAEQLDDWVTRLEAIPEVDTRIDALSAFPKVERLVPIGVLRGGSVDTGQWRIDPARPAVVIGTVDMIGSRLLFSGYSDGRTRRALHAGLLGYDMTRPRYSTKPIYPRPWRTCYAASPTCRRRAGSLGSMFSPCRRPRIPQ